MRKLLRLTLILLLILALTASLFACKKKSTPDQTEPLGKEELARAAVDAELPNGENNEKVASALLTLLTDAGLEDAEIRTALTAYAGGNNSCAVAFTDLAENNYSSEHFASYREALQILANAVSPEVAGSVFYTAASATKNDLPYTLSDCRKIASLLLTDETNFEGLTLENLLTGDYTAATEKRINTLLLSLSSSLRKAVGISDGAKTYLYSLAMKGINDFIQSQTSDLSDETLAAINKGKLLMIALADIVKDGYDVLLTGAADFFSFADAKLLFGLPYEKKETTVYYGYYSEDWRAVIITKEQYEAQDGDYDKYLKIEDTMKGFTVNGAFVPITDQNAALADRVYRLYAGYRAYQALSPEDAASFRAISHQILSVLSEEPGILANLLDRELTECDDPIATEFDGQAFDKMIDALATLSAFDATDGVSEKESALAESAIAVFEGYLHRYLPRVY